VVGIALTVEEDDIGDGNDGLDDGVEGGGVTAFGEIGDALDELAGHLLF
jgi:hypothetical protein